MEYECPQILRNQRIISLDIETTGLDIRLNTIIELGVVEVDDGVEKLKYSRLFGGGTSSPNLVKNIHHIKDCEREGKSTFRESAKKIADYLCGAVLVTHNGAKFDIPFMEYQMKQVGVSMSYVKHYDTYLISRNLKKDVLDEKGNKMTDEDGKTLQENIHEHHSLEYLCGVYDIPYNEQNHRGLKDCWCTLQLLYALTSKFPGVL